MLIKASAKINISLDITGKRPDGYHDVEMIMQEISLYDEVEVTKAEEISVSSGLSFIPSDRRNIAYKAAEAFFQETGMRGGAKIKIKKNIPVGAGLGGGSTDGAAVITALNRLYGADLKGERLVRAGLYAGADVPFFFMGGTCLAEGLGEILTPVASKLNGWAVIIKPKFSVSTKWAYENFNISSVKQHPDTKLLIDAVRRGDMRLLAENMRNVLEEVVLTRYHDIAFLKRVLIKRGALGAMMSGSGSAVFGLFDSEDAARDCADALAGELKETVAGIYVCKML